LGRERKTEGNCRGCEFSTSDLRDMSMEVIATIPGGCFARFLSCSSCCSESKLEQSLLNPRKVRRLTNLLRRDLKDFGLNIGGLSIELSTPAFMSPTGIVIAAFDGYDIQMKIVKHHVQDRDLPDFDSGGITCQQLHSCNGHPGSVNLYDVLNWLIQGSD
jgi:hypothetical protein